MIRVSLSKNSVDSSYTVIVENTRINYKFEGETYVPKVDSYTGKIGNYEHDEALLKAIEDAMDWTTKLSNAGVECRLVENW